MESFTIANPQRDVNTESHMYGPRDYFERGNQETRCVRQSPFKHIFYATIRMKGLCSLQIGFLKTVGFSGR